MIVIGEESISLQQVVAVAQSREKVAVSSRKSFLDRMEESRSVLEKSLAEGTPVYGVTTGYGACCGNRLDTDDIEELKQLGTNLIKYHGCGVGEPLDIEETRAAMLCRMVCLSQGYSAISVELLERLADLLNEGITPLVPCMGSVGASGDLTPMSYIAAVLAGEREVFYRGNRMPAAEALLQAGLKPYEFKLKEPLAMINGTSVMTGIASIAVIESRRILNAALAGTALAVHALAGHPSHFHPLVSEAKPHPGQINSAKVLNDLLVSADSPPESAQPFDLQDPYSIRCAPQVLGVLDDALSWIERWIEIEINSANDNPLLDGGLSSEFMGGNFYGGHVVFSMDALKAALASVGDILDRQVALLVDERFNRGLPANLVAAGDEGRGTHHGFKGVQITASALAAEALKNTMPAGSFSRSTESHNQDKVSMGTIAARDARRQCFLVSRVAAVSLLAAAQAAQLRGALDSRPGVAKLVEYVRSVAPGTREDRRMDVDIENLAQAIYEMDLTK